MKGRYVVIEGLDGSGKSTQHELVCKAVENNLAIREPGFTPAGEAIRSLVKDPAIPRSPRTNSFLFSAARVDLIDTVVRPAITSGQHVISDRNWLSTAAYQQVEGAEAADVLQLARLAAKEFFTPDLVIFIDVSAKECQKRLFARGQTAKDYFDSKGVDYFANVREAYLDALQNVGHYIVVDGSQPVDGVYADIMRALKANLPQLF